jgi:phenylacetate-CoA ligase
MEETMTSKVEAIKNLTETLNHLQWYTPKKIREIQTNKLKALVAYHVKNSQWFSERIRTSNLKPNDVFVENITALPLLSRRDIQSAGEGFFCKEVPKSHGKIGTVKTSGSTGEPVVVKATDVVSQFFHSLNYQEVMWHKRDFKLRMAAIRAGQHENKEVPDWGLPYSKLHETGPGLIINIETDILEQDKLLRKFRPEILIVYPNNLKALLDIWEKDPPNFKLKHIKTVGETVSDSLRDRVKSFFDLTIEDIYSSQEVGSIANKCPDSDLYHTMDSNLIVEIIDDEGNPVKTGSVGRIVITDLHNYASPIIRYVIGDYAERGPICHCGRGFLTLKKIMGRERNLIVQPDGSKYWPMVGMYQFDGLDFVIRKYQVIQHDRENIEYKIVTDEPITLKQSVDLVNIAKKALGDHFTYKVTRYDKEWPLPPNGKFEEFVCKVQNS